MFLIISSSVYPAIMSSMENKEMKIISKVLGKLNEENNNNNNVHSTIPMPSSEELVPSSPTPVAPIFSATSSNTNNDKSSDVRPMQTVEQQQQQDEEVDNKMVANIINPGAQVHTVWDDTPGNDDIFYKRDGADYDPTTVNLSNDVDFSANAAIAVLGNNVHVVWVGLTTNDILYSRSTNAGGSFNSKINLSENTGFSEFPAIAASGNNVHVVWHDDTSENSEIFYRRSTDGGASFTEPTKNLSNDAGFSDSPAIAASGNNVHVVWRDSSSGIDILYKKSQDGGAAFPNVIKNLSSNSGISEFPAIAASGNNVHVVWSDTTSGNLDIFYRRSLDGGSTFPNIIKNLSSNTGNSVDPAIAVSSHDVHVVWEDTSPGNPDTLYRRSINGGATFPNVIKNLSGDAVDSHDPAIAVSDNNVYTVWAGFTSGSFDIFYRTSPNSGVSFPNIVSNLSATTGDSVRPAIAAP
jgi:hypothetical protein